MTRKKKTKKKWGRPLNWFRHWCNERLQDPESIELMNAVIRGEEIDDQVIIATGEKVPIKPKAKDRVDLLLRLAEYGVGKPVQLTQMLDAEGNAVAPAVILTPQSKGEAGKVK